jgi:hypothetical protein
MTLSDRPHQAASSRRSDKVATSGCLPRQAGRAEVIRHTAAWAVPRRYTTTAPFAGVKINKSDPERRHKLELADPRRPARLAVAGNDLTLRLTYTETRPN